MKKYLPYITVLIFLIVALIVDFSNHKWERNEVLNYDIFGYHNYLPALIIYKDITKYNYLDSIERKYNPTNGAFNKYGLHPSSKDSNLCNQYPIGVSIFQTPLFIVAHLWATISKKDTPNGYSSPYQLAVVFSTLFFALLSLVILIKFLQNYFSNPIIFFTILLITFATNFFHYATLESGLSHIYQFFLYSTILYLSVKWYLKANIYNSIYIGICIGLAIVTRPVDILICLIPLFWSNPNSVINKSQYLKNNLKYIFIIITFTFLSCLPQMFYWKYVTGNWIYYSYSTVDYFQFNRFRVIHGLFSYRKGWFIYTPLALIAFIQAYNLKPKTTIFFYKKVFWIYFIPTIFLVFSWHNWFYGWSFSCRALLGAIPILAVPIAYFLQTTFQQNVYKKIIATLALVFITFLNLFQTWQYEHYILHGTLMNESLYWQLFLKTQKPQDLDKNFKLQDELDWNTGGW